MSSPTGTSDAILRCARSLIEAGGYNGFSYADIAAVVGIRKASIHHHFPAKADLVRVLVARYREEAEVAIVELGRAFPNPVDQLRAYVDYWAACIGDGSRTFCVCALLASEMPALPPAVAVEVGAYFRLFSAWLTELLEQGAGQGAFALSAAAGTEAEIFIATVHGAMLSARAYGDPRVFAAITRPLIARLVPAQP